MNIICNSRVMPKVKSFRQLSKRVNPLKTLNGQKAKNDGENNGMVNRIISELESKYKENENLAEAVKMKKYMRDQFEMFGLKAPVRRSIDQEVLKNTPVLNQDQIHQLLKLLWQKRERDFQMFGCDSAANNVKLLLGEDIESCRKSLMAVKDIIMTKSWWDTVDMLAYKVVGKMVSSYRSELQPVMDQWIDDDNMWIRRTAILHQLSYKTDTDDKQLFSYCLKRCHEKEFFIQKSIGWALREYAKTNKQGVKAFVSNNKNKMAPLSVREAMKHIS